MSISYHMPSRNPPASYRAPGAKRHATPPSSRRWPRLDDHLVKPESGEEMVRGQRIMVAGANPPHADTQAGIAAMITGRMRQGYTLSTELLTRFNERSNFATDVCVRKDGIDPSTDERHLEELAFEVISEQRMSYMTERAEDLAARGVRRIIGVFLKKECVGEWCSKERTWRWLALDSVLDDPCLASPIPVKTLLQATSAAKVKEAVARGMVETKHPVIEKVRIEGIQAGLAPLVRQFERRLARSLAPAERAVLLERLQQQGAERLADVVLDLSREELAAWLAAPRH
jgi:hypothetical protein